MAELLEAAGKGDLRAIKLLLEGTEPPLVDTQDGLGNSALLIAADKGDEVMTSLLLGHGADVFVTDKNGVGPLRLAALFGKQAVVGILSVRHPC
jgi:ankyrin repeat protein